MRPRATVKTLSDSFLKKGAEKEGKVVKLRKVSTSAPKGSDQFGADTLFVSAAVLVNLNGEVLLAERPHGKNGGGLWEFPGGKVENGESPIQTLVRELGEELAIRVDTNSVTPLTFIHCEKSVPNKKLVMFLHKVTKWRGEVEGLEGQKIAWVSVDSLLNYVDIMPKADIPLAEFIVKNPTVLD